jgi:hypothetical protein
MTIGAEETDGAAGLISRQTTARLTKASVNSGVVGANPMARFLLLPKKGYSKFREAEMVVPFVYILVYFSIFTQCNKLCSQDLPALRGQIGGGDRCCWSKSSNSTTDAAPCGTAPLQPATPQQPRGVRSERQRRRGDNDAHLTFLGDDFDLTNKLVTSRSSAKTIDTLNSLDADNLFSESRPIPCRSWISDLRPTRPVLRNEPD